MLNEEQAIAVDGILEAYKKFYTRCSDINVVGLFGAGGTGKTYTALEVINAILAYRQSQGRHQTKILFCAPTNDAKNELKKSIYRSMPSCDVQFRTVASTLGRGLDLDERGKIIFTGAKDGAFKDLTILCVDEASMVNSKDTELLLKNALHKDVFVLAMGDCYQHFPVKETTSPLIEACSISFDLVRNMRLLDSNNPIAKIQQVCRQAVIDKTPAFDYRAQFQENELTSDRTGHYFYWDEADGYSAMHSAWAKAWKMDDPHRIKIICYTNAKIDQLNEVVRSRLFGDQAGYPYLPGEFLVAKAPVKRTYSIDGLLREVTVIDNGALVRVVSTQPATFYLERRTIKPKRKEYTFEYSYEGMIVNVEHCETKAQYEVKLLTRESYKQYNEDVEKLRVVRNQLKKTYEYNFTSYYMSLIQLVDKFNYAYAVNTHTVQGKSARTVIGVIDNIVGVSEAQAESKRRALYVLVTRPRDILISC
jgi:AAA domain